MSTPLTDRINSLISQANEATGVSDTTLSDAVESLVAGYGQGSGVNALKVKNVTVPYEIYQNAEIMLNWLLSVVPQSVYAVVMRDEALTDMARGNGTLLEALFINNNAQNTYIRFYNNSVQAPTGSVWTSTYHVSADEGDKYSIFYQE